jgi:glycosyltransferase involved in cell wall biosynthesis
MRTCKYRAQITFMKKTNFIILTDVPFPYGTAPTNRVLSYANGLLRNNIAVQVVIFRTASYEKDNANIPASGNYHDIPYIYTSNTVTRETAFIKRRMQDFTGLINAIRYIFALPGNPETAIIAYTINPIAELLFFFLVRIKGFHYITETSEHPSVYFKGKSIASRLLYFYYYNFNYRLYDYLFVMTQNLIDVMAQIKRKNAKILHVPMTVEIERFKKVKTGSNEKYIAYAGYLNQDKDGVLTLIESFHLVLMKHPDLKLYLIGQAPDDGELKRVTNKIAECNLQEKVIITGNVNREELPILLCNATILALARPSSLQAQMGFPTKLGEYLATANPVVVTGVGEIPKYLDDNINAFISEPDSSTAFAQKMEVVLADPDNAKKVGLAGRAAAEKYFNNITQAKTIIEFVQSNN